MKEKEGSKYESILSAYGKDILVTKETMDKTLERVSTGSITFDKALGTNGEGKGGYPLGKVIEFHGAESSGKSTLCLHAIAEFQKTNTGDVLLIDGEHSFDATYAKAIGVNIDKLLLSQPNNLETAYNLALDMISLGTVRLVIVDSHTSLPAKRRLENKIGKDEVALEQRINSDALRKLKYVVAKYNCAFIGVSQLRANVASRFGGSQGTGGNAWKFYSDIRIKIYRSTDKEKETDMVNVEVIKNKTSQPFQICEIPIKWGVGIDKYTELIMGAVQTGDLVRGGSYYFSKNKETNLAQGVKGMTQFLEDNPDYFKKLHKDVSKSIMNQK